MESGCPSKSPLALALATPSLWAGQTISVSENKIIRSLGVRPVCKHWPLTEWAVSGHRSAVTSVSAQGRLLLERWRWGSEHGSAWAFVCRKSC